FFFSSRRRHTRSKRDWSSDVCSSDLLSTDRRTEAQAGGIPLLYSLTKNTATRQLKARCDLQQGYACSQYSREAQLWFKLQENWRSEERRVGKEGRYGWWGDQNRSEI